jgi:Predicted glycosyltransferases
LQWKLPPAEIPGRWQLLDRVVGSRLPVWARLRDRRRAKGRMLFWSLEKTTPVRALSGAVMAIRASAFDAAGGFDEGYPLYFEEHDFLRRVTGRILYVPESRVRHLYNQSAGGSSEAAAFFAISEERFLRRWTGRTGMTLKRLERPSSARLAFVPFPEGGIRLHDREVVVEASPLPTFETAAGCFPHSETLTIPDDLWACYRGEALYVRVVERRSGVTIGAYTKARMVP